MTEIAVSPPKGIKLPGWLVPVGALILLLNITILMKGPLVSNRPITDDPITNWETQGVSGCSDAYGTFDAFYPGMRGFGTCNRGGFVPNTNIVVVTNRNDSGAGSLRNAIVSEACPKVILFNVSGFWDSSSIYVVNQGCDGLSLVGASAPGNVVIGDQPSARIFGLRGDNQTFDHVTVAPGGIGAGGFVWGRNEWSDNILLMNIAVFWSSDEALTCYSGRNTTSNPELTTNTTVWQAFISHGVLPQEYGPLWHYTCPRATFARNVNSHMTNRNPMMRNDELTVANNLVYDREWQSALTPPCTGNVGAPNPPLTDQNWINNVDVRGPSNTSSHGYIMGSGEHSDCTDFLLWEEGTQVMNPDTSLQDCSNHQCVNIGTGPRDIWADEVATSIRTRGLPPGFVWEDTPTTTAEVQAFGEKLLTYAGPRPNDRLPYLQDRINEVIAGLYNSGDKGVTITSSADVGGAAALTEPQQSWDVLAQCPTHEGNPSNNPYGFHSSGLMNLHVWVIECFYDSVMPAGWREEL